jgi:hypothetical protein
LDPIDPATLPLATRELHEEAGLGLLKRFQNRLERAKTMLATWKDIGELLSIGHAIDEATDEPSDRAGRRPMA